jgi:hypothetical protein|tara:strand:+ start:1617 stop:2087 length:471 start_codon:yes stop_codon:yes gene_type:complete
MIITLTLTEEEASALHDLVGWAGDTIGEMLDDAKHEPEPDENDKEVVEIYEPLFNISQRVSELVEATITENHIMGKPGACPRCGEDNSKPPFLLEQTGSDAHCDHEVEYNYSCDNCGCRFDEVWMYSHKQVTRDPKDFTPEEVEKWGNETTINTKD